MSDIIDVARDFVRVCQEDGHAKNRLMPGEFEDLVEALAREPRADANLDGRTGQCVCPRCGRGEVFPLPMPVDAMTPWVRYFAVKHRYCRAKVEPTREGER